MMTRERFVQSLHESRAATFKVGQWLHLLGYDVRIPAFYIPTAKNDPGISDKGDIFIVKKDQPEKRMEVKHRPKLNFTTKEDWPFKDGMFVSNVEVVERGDVNLGAYIIVNGPMTHIAIIRPETRRYWTQVDVWCSNTRKTERKFQCPVEHIQFRSISE